MKAQMHVSAVEFTCPKCKENIPHRSGSHMFELFEIPDELVCQTCDIKVQVPEKAKKLKQPGS